MHASVRDRNVQAVRTSPRQTDRASKHRSKVASCSARAKALWEETTLDKGGASRRATAATALVMPINEMRHIEVYILRSTDKSGAFG